MRSRGRNDRVGALLFSDSVSARGFLLRPGKLFELRRLVRLALRIVGYPLARLLAIAKVPRAQPRAVLAKPLPVALQHAVARYHAPGLDAAVLVVVDALFHGNELW